VLQLSPKLNLAQYLTEFRPNPQTLKSNPNETNNKPVSNIKKLSVMGSKNFHSKLLALQGNLLNFAYLLTSNRDDAYDLLQDTTLKALDNEDKYIDNVNFKGWVFTIMRNIFINNYRKVVRSATMIDQTDDLYHLNLPQESGLDTPEGSFSASEITEAINSFSDDYRVPFSMHVSGYKYNEIAEKMNLPLGTVKSRIFFARQRLQKMLKDYK
jgi:RNA polymerase sigma-70 factor (ECF subfamily)